MKKLPLLKQKPLQKREKLKRLYPKLKLDDFTSPIFCKYYTYLMETVLP